jgi:hypothetical protein
VRSLQITIPTLVGDLVIYANGNQQAKAEKLIRETPNILNNAYKLAGLAFAERLAKIAKECISRGMPPPDSGVSWPPHTEKTIKAIGEHTLLYWSSQYYRNIKPLQRGKQIAVGLTQSRIKTRPDGRINKNPKTLTWVAKVLEFGSSDGRIPPRPLWSVLWDNTMADKYKKQLVLEIRKQIRNTI